MDVKSFINHNIEQCVQKCNNTTVIYFLSTLKEYVKYSGSNTLEYHVDSYLDTLCIHSVNVAYISCLIGWSQYAYNKHEGLEGFGEFNGFKEAEIKYNKRCFEFNLNNLVECALLHDIGKLYIDSSILGKKGRLTPQEREEVQKHSSIGYDTLVKDDYFRRKEDVLTGVLHHHERLDGTGYPHGITGETLDLYSRIISVADSYDAMTSYRIYNKIKNPIEAISELESMENQYDIQLVEILMGRFNNKLHEF